MNQNQQSFYYSFYFLLSHKNRRKCFFCLFVCLFVLHSIEILVSRSNWDSCCVFLGLDSSQAVSGIFATAAPTVIPQGTLMGR